MHKIIRKGQLVWVAGQVCTVKGVSKTDIYIEDEDCRGYTYDISVSSRLITDVTIIKEELIKKHQDDLARLEAAFNKQLQKLPR